MRVFDERPGTRFQQSYVVGARDDCWVWLGPVNRSFKQPRAMFSPGNQRLMTTAARFAWEWYVAPIPKGLHVLHRCDNPLCVNHHHLFLGTYRENVQDMVAKGRHAKIKNRGEKHGNTKLSDRDFLEIFQLRGHMFVWEIAQAYGITPAYVSHIQLGRYKR